MRRDNGIERRRIERDELGAESFQLQTNVASSVIKVGQLRLLDRYCFQE